MLPSEHYEKYKDVIDQAFNEVVKHPVNGYHTCYYGCIDKTGQWIRGFGNGPCYGGVMGLKGSVAIFNKVIQLPRVNEENQAIFYDYLANHSPWADAFISKDTDKVMKDGLMVLQTDMPANYIIGAAIATRFMWETSRMMDRFVLLAKAGVNRDLAYLLALIADGLEFTNKSVKVVLVRYMTFAHICHDANILYKNDIKNFFNKNIVRPAKHTFQENGTYDYIDNMWDGEGGKELVDYLDKYLNGSKQEVSGPFSKALRANTSFDKEDFIKCMVEHGDEIMKEIMS